MSVSCLAPSPRLIPGPRVIHPHFSVNGCSSVSPPMILTGGTSCCQRRTRKGCKDGGPWKKRRADYRQQRSNDPLPVAAQGALGRLPGSASLCTVRRATKEQGGFVSTQPVGSRIAIVDRL